MPLLVQHSFAAVWPYWISSNSYMFLELSCRPTGNGLIFYLNATYCFSGRKGAFSLFFIMPFFFKHFSVCDLTCVDVCGLNDKNRRHLKEAVHLWRWAFLRFTYWSHSFWGCVELTEGAGMWMDLEVRGKPFLYFSSYHFDTSYL